MQSTHQSNLSKEYRRKKSCFEIPKYMSIITNYKSKCLEKTHHKFFSNINSEFTKLLKNRIPYSQAPQLKRIFSTKKDFDYHS